MHAYGLDMHAGNTDTRQTFFNTFEHNSIWAETLFQTQRAPWTSFGGLWVSASEDTPARTKVTSPGNHWSLRNSFNYGLHSPSISCDHPPLLSEHSHTNINFPLRAKPKGALALSYICCQLFLMASSRAEQKTCIMICNDDIRNSCYEELSHIDASLEEL